MLRRLESACELEQALNETRDLPELRQIHCSIQTMLLNRFPYPDGSILDLKLPLSFYFISRNFIIICHDNNAVFDEQSVNIVFLGILAQFPNFYFRGTDVWYHGSASFYDSYYVPWLNEQFPGSEIERHPCVQYYINQEDTKRIQDEKIVLAEGYFFDGIHSQQDVDFIRNSWKYCSPGEGKQFGAKLNYMPYSIIRKEGEPNPVAFELMDPSGFLNHHYTQLEHRRKGLGAAVELELAQNCLRLGIHPFKLVEAWNNSVLETSNRSRYWSRLEYDDGEVVPMYFAVHFMKKYLTS
uniref:Glycine N-acyltransferase-like protein n=1 Tax=Acrobeloides nanus TaxID=290746 RepID=A0A914C2N4_9BILA